MCPRPPHSARHQVRDDVAATRTHFERMAASVFAGEWADTGDADEGRSTAAERI